ncbi:hypothetical protein ABLE68_03465 [Nocardioides sp. CN2-186]|uniref:hypothetical protein n=1 Tax=Nocardioides tweenelious TaxID=3156607 RepID=UPI0032B358E8
MTWKTTLAAIVAALIVCCGLGAAALAAIDAPPGDTIVEVEGDQANGFGIYHYDGTEEFPPTDSEARAECGEYDARADRIRCRVEVRTWYRDLGDLQQALDWAHAQ